MHDFTITYTFFFFFFFCVCASSVFEENLTLMIQMRMILKKVVQIKLIITELLETWVNTKCHTYHISRLDWCLCVCMEVWLINWQIDWGICYDVIFRGQVADNYDVISKGQVVHIVSFSEVKWLIHCHFQRLLLVAV